MVLRGRQRVPVRRLGSWAAKFDEARTSTLAVRKALGDELQDVFKVEWDEAEAKALEAEAKSAPGSQLTLVLSVESTAVAILRAAVMPSGQTDGSTGLLIGAQSDPALPLSSIGPKLISTAREELKLRGVERTVAVAPLQGLCEWICR